MKGVGLTLLLLCVVATTALQLIPKNFVRRFAMKVAFHECYSESAMAKVQAGVLAAAKQCANSSVDITQPLYWSMPIGIMEIFQEATYRFMDEPSKLHGPVFLEDFDLIAADNAKFLDRLICAMKAKKFLTNDAKVDYDYLKGSIGYLKSQGTPAEVHAHLLEAVDECRGIADFKANQVQNGTFNNFAQPLFFYRCIKDMKLSICAKWDFMRQMEAAGMSHDEVAEEFDLINTYNIFSTGDIL